jgi:methylenetetrahydrofolate dehydrogenase (NADP+)/methenyltetrahydrofolate cyclohydrolase
VAQQIKEQVKSEIEELKTTRNIVPCLAAVRVGEDPASAVYVRNKIAACGEVGIRSEHHALPDSTITAELLELIRSLNSRDDVDGILTQLPLSKNIDETAIIDAIDASKDVDGFHPINVGKLSLGRPQLVPCTPAGIIELLDYYKVDIRGVDACVVGRSQIVGRPMVQLLLQRDATVTVCHSRTRDLAAVTRAADLLIVAIGRAGMIGRNHIKPGATVVDVGMNKLADADIVRGMFGSETDKRLTVLAKRGYTLVGDVNPSEALEVAGKFTPVPGGVGLLTVAMLMKNTLKAAKMRRGLVN